MGRKMVPNQRLNGNTVGGSGSFKAWPGHIVLPDRQRRMEFAGGCQKVSILCEGLKPLFTALSTAQAPFVLLLLPLSPAFFSLGCARSAPGAFCPKSGTKPPRLPLCPATFPPFTDGPTLIPARQNEPLDDPRRNSRVGIGNTREFTEREGGNSRQSQHASLRQRSELIYKETPEINKLKNNDSRYNKWKQEQKSL